MHWGQYIAKISVTPLAANVQALTGTKADNIKEFSSIRDAVGAFFKTNSAKYELRAQLCTDIAAMPVEDVLSYSPWHTLAAH